MKLFFVSLEFACILLLAVPVLAQDMAVGAPTQGMQKVEMQGLALDVSSLQAKVVSATARLFKLKECHSKGMLFRTISNGTEDCKAVLPCTLPWGPILAVGASATAYQAASVPYGSSCVAEVRTCAENTGSLTGSFQYQTCTVTGGATCSLPWGGSLANGASTTAYQTATGNPSCASQVRTCNNGTLSGSYTYGSCSAAASCTAPWGGTMLHGTSVTAYQASTVSYGSSCQSQTRTCSNGTLSGSYTASSCSVAAPVNCTAPWGGAVAHGGFVYGSRYPVIWWWETCSIEYRWCNNGTLSGSYNYNTCNYGHPSDH